MDERKLARTDADLLKMVGARIREKRLQLGLSLRDLAYSVGMESSNLSVIENGKSNPQLLTYAKIAAALHMDLSELFAFSINVDVFNEMPNSYQPRKHVK
jgi:transcriptional regulator with XRE-family HTH domain